MFNKFIFTASFILLSFVLKAGDTISKKNSFIIKVDILTPIVNIVRGYQGGSLTLEYCFKRRHSIQLAGSFFNNTRYQLKTNTNSIAFVPMYKYFLSKRKNYTGFYTGLYLLSAKATTIWDYRSYSERSYLKFTETDFGGGLLFGYQNYIKKRLVIDILIGGGALQTVDTKIVKAENTSLVPSNSISPNAILLFNVGYKF